MKIYLTYFGYFGWLIVLAYFQNRLPRLVSRHENVQDRTVTRYNWIFALLAAAPLVYLAATRGSFVDTGMYVRSFANAPSSFSAIPAYVNALKKDRAFYLFAAVWRTILGNRPVAYFAIIAAFQILCFTRTVRKYAPYLLTSFFIFVASTDYLSYMQNGIRQFVAVCIIFAASKWIFERNYIPAILMILVASQFHQSALLMIPVIFIVQGDPWNKSTVGVLLAAMIAVVFVDRFTDILNDLLSETQYANVVSDWTAWNDNGTNPLRVLVYSVPAILSLVGLPQIREADDHIINVCVNMSIISASLFIISMETSGIFIGRLPIYVCLYANCILLPWEIENVFSKESGRFIKAAMIVLFMFFYYYQISSVWHLI